MQGGKALFLAFLLMAGLSASFGSQNEDAVEYAPWCEDGLDNDGDGQTDEEDIHCGADWNYGEGAPNEAPPLVVDGD